ncbi:MAG: hypothetical protein LAO04_15580 [Acidobacteriia bacterium]|nr:hypothetical protein [Terriglobia bacterium]
MIDSIDHGLFFFISFLVLNINQPLLQKAYAQPPPWNADARVSYFKEREREEAAGSQGFEKSRISLPISESRI